MTQQALGALQQDARDLAGALHVLADGAKQRGDEDVHSSARLLARHAESLQLAIEQLGQGDDDE